MNDMIRFGGILLIVSAIAAAGLTAVYQVTKPRIDEQKAMELQDALAVALPGADLQSLRPVTDQGHLLYYNGFASPDTTRLVGRAFLASGFGYSSTILSMVGVDTTGKIIGIKILSQGETPGLGTKVQEIRRGEQWPWFQQQFLGRPVSGLAVDKDGGEIKGITGATISSRAVTKSIVVSYNNLIRKQE
jgi:electron transport complex protein RnfG